MNLKLRKRQSRAFCAIARMQNIIEKRLYDAPIAYLEHRCSETETVKWEAVRAKMVEALVPLYLDAVTDEVAARAKIEAEIGGGCFSLDPWNADIIIAEPV